jgi:pSer/pThr/pTyr-binding forkhead associated (FHA) protein
VPDLTRRVPVGILLQPTRVSASTEPTRISLPFGPEIQIATGPAAGTRIPVGYDPFVFGRAESGAGNLGGDPELSRRHASVSSLDAGRLLLEDLASTNGTFLNGNRIFAPTVVAPGDEIRMGSTTMRVTGRTEAEEPDSLRGGTSTEGPPGGAARP